MNEIHAISSSKTLLLATAANSILWPVCNVSVANEGFSLCLCFNLNYGPS